MSATGKFQRPKFGGFGSMGIGTKLLMLAPRLKSNAMLLGRFMPDTADVIANIECGVGTALLTPHVLAVGPPKTGLSMPTGGTGFAGLGQIKSGVPQAVNIQSVWGLYDSQSQVGMFVTITEKTATAAGGTTQAKFVEAEFAKNKPIAMTLTVYKGKAQQVATTFPADAGYAKFIWQKA